MSESIYTLKRSSIPQKLTMQIFSWSAIAFVAWSLYGSGGAVAGGWLGSVPETCDPVRRGVLLACAVIYAARLVLTQFHLIKRAMAWKESLTIAVWVCIIQLTMAGLGGTNSAPAGLALYAGVLLYVAGSVINSGSELLRDRWKKRPANKGQLYTFGLFHYAIHVNYFGDVVLFSGFALVTGSLFAFAIPLVMLLMFVFVNIPMLDAYLADHYGAQFVAYRARTAKLVPFVY